MFDVGQNSVTYSEVLCSGQGWWSPAALSNRKWLQESQHSASEMLPACVPHSSRPLRVFPQWQSLFEDSALAYIWGLGFTAWRVSPVFSICQLNPERVWSSAMEEKGNCATLKNKQNALIANKKCAAWPALTESQRQGEWERRAEVLLNFCLTCWKETGFAVWYFLFK